MQAIDLTLRLKKDNPIFQKAKSGSSSIWKMGHIGTHLDIVGAPEIPLDYRYSKGRIYDVSDVGDRDVEISDLKSGKPESGEFVLFRTGFIQKCDYAQPGYFRRHPQLSQALLSYLVTKNIRFIGLDGPGVRRGAEHAKADRMCAEHGTFIIENMVNLDQVPLDTPFHLMCLWIYQEGMTGIPCRVIAEIDPLARLDAASSSRSVSLASENVGSTSSA